MSIVAVVLLALAGPALGAGTISVEFNAPYNLVVDSNVCSPSTYAPRIGTIGAGFCNYGDAALTDVNAFIGDFAAGTPGTYPVRDSDTDPAFIGPNAQHPHLATSGDYFLTHIGDQIDSSRYVGTLDVGECSWQYWSFTYPRRENPDTCGDPVWGDTNDPNDDLWLDFDVWATSAEGPATDGTWTVTMRNEISASANKIFPNNGQWFNDPDTCVPGQTVTTNGINYELGVVNKGFDNDGDGNADYNAWLQPIGDNNWNPACFRLVHTEGQLQISRSALPTLYLDFVDQLYFTDLPADNNGVTGVVEYTFMCLGGACNVPLTPYQEAASGSDNEKFAGDYGASTVLLKVSSPEVDLTKTVIDDGDNRAAGNEALTFNIDFQNNGSVGAGEVDLGVPLVLRDSIPAETTYFPGSAFAGNTLDNCASDCYTVLYSTDGGVSWASTEPATASDVTDLQWRLTQPLAPTEEGHVQFQVLVDPVPTVPVIENCAGASFGDSPEFAESCTGIPVLGSSAIGDTVFQDDGTLTANDGNHDTADEIEIGAVELSLYWDRDGDGELSTGDLLIDTTTSGINDSNSGCGSVADTNYCFDLLAAGDYLVVVDTAAASIPTGYRLTTPAPGSPSEVVAVTGLAVGATDDTADFGFGPSLVIDKTLVSATPSLAGDSVVFDIQIQNTRPATSACQYTVWGDDFDAANSDAIDNANATGVLGPDSLYAAMGEGGGGDGLRIIDYTLSSFPGSITQVEAIFWMYLEGTVVDDDLDFFVQDGTTTGATYNLTPAFLNANASNTWYLHTQDITADPNAWLQTEFANSFIDFDYKHVGGSDSAPIRIDAVGFRITTDQTCGAPSDNMAIVPLDDIFDASLLTFVSATDCGSAPSTLAPTCGDGDDQVDAPDSQTSAGAPYPNTGILGWTDVGPLLAGWETRYRVTFQALQPPDTDFPANGEPDTVPLPNTAEVTNATFFDGSPVNDATDTDTGSLVPTGFIDGTVWNDNGNGGGISGDGAQNGTEQGIENVTVELYEDTNNDGVGDVLLSSTTTDANGDYLFDVLLSNDYVVLVVSATLPGSSFTETGDPDEVGTCGTCDDDGSATLDLADGDPLTDSATLNYGYLVPNAVYGRVFEDNDGDGIEEVGENGLAGVTVSLLDCGPDTICGNGDDGATATTTTDAIGDYSFEDLGNGNYRVLVDDLTAPLGATWAQTADTDEVGTCVTCDDQTSSTILVSGGNVYGTFDFGYRNTGASSIGDTVYADWDGDGIQEAGEAGVANITVSLYEDSNGDGVIDPANDALVATTTTNGSGIYSFTGLPGDDWIVVVDEADADWPWTKSQTQDPDEAGVCVSCTGTGSVTTDGINPILTIDFGYKPSGYGSIGDTVWNDANGDGIQGGTESGIPNMPLTLYYDTNGNGVIDIGIDPVVAAAITDSGAITNVTGNYLFTGLIAGNYLVDVDTTAPQLPTDGNGDAYVLTSGQDPIPVALAANQQYLAADFGFGPGGTIGDTVYQDNDGDGNQSLSEPGVQNVTVDLYEDTDGDGTYETLVGTLVTDVNGNYAFTGLPPGEYQVRVDTTDTDLPSIIVSGDPDILLDGQTDVTLGSGQIVRFADFGFQPDAVLGDAVWIDGDGNGVYDPLSASDDPLAGVTVQLFEDCDNNSVYTPLATTTTDSSGYYSFGDLITTYAPCASNLFAVVVDGATLPANLTQTYDPDEVGTCTTCDGQGFPAALAPGSSDLDQDFGYQRGPQLTIDKDTSTPKINAGGQATWTIVVRSVGGQNVTGVTITDTLPGVGACSPDCFTYASGSVTLAGGAFVDAGPTPAVPAAGDTSLTWDHWEIPPGASVTITFTVDVDIATPVATYDNTAASTSDNAATVDDDGLVPQDDDTPTGQDPEADEDVSVGAGPSLTIVKANNPIGIVTPGQTITYTVTVTNVGAAAAHDVRVNDPLPTGTVNGAAGFLTWNPGNYQDDFEGDTAGSLPSSGSTGSAPWISSWNDTGSANANVQSDGGDLSLDMIKNSDIQRAVNLDPTIFATANLSFGYRRFSLGGTLNVRAFDGTTDTIIATITNPPTDDGAYQAFSQDITAQMSASSYIRFEAIGFGNNDDVFIDDVTITLTYPGHTGTVAGDAPPAVVPVSKGYDLGPGESFDVTFTVDVDNPAPDGVASIDNTAFAQSNETPVISDSVTNPLNSGLTGAIGDFVWDDTDGQGDQDVGESGLENVTLLLYRDDDPGDGLCGGSGDTLIATELTDSSGAYLFSSLDTSVGGITYCVQVDEATLPVSYALTTGNEPYYTTLTDGTPTDLTADFGYNLQVTPLPVTLSSFKATPVEEGMLFEWTTNTESGNLGFFIYADVGGEWALVTEDLIPSNVVDSVQRQSYSVIGDAVQSDTFLLVDLDIQGHARFHGPFGVGPSDISDPPEIDPIPWGQIRQEHETKLAVRHGGWKHRDLPAVRLLVSEDGIHRVTFEDLLAEGLDLSGVPFQQLAMSDRHGSVPIWIDGNGTFGPGEAFEFYGQSYETLYTDENLYTLRLDPSSAERIPTDNSNGQLRSPTTVYTETTRIERDRTYNMAAPNGDPWYDRWILAPRRPVTQRLWIRINDLDTENPEAMLDLGLWGFVNWPDVTLDHHILVSLNGEELVEDYFAGNEDHPVHVELPPGLLHEGWNSIDISMPLDTGVPWDIVALDSYSITHSRHLVTRNGHLVFEGDDSDSFTVSGISSDDPVVYRVRDRYVERVSRVSVSSTSTGTTATFAGDSEPATYMVASTDSFLKPGILPAPPVEDILSETADYLVISHPDFIEGLSPLLDLRASQGYTVRVVDVQQIYENFSGGVMDPTAIQQFITTAADSLGAEHVLLVGGDSYDYKDYLRIGAVSFIPSIYTKTSDRVSWAPSDPLYGDVDGDGVPDLPIGRLPVRTSEELGSIVGKILAYETKGYGRTFLSATDAYDTYQSISFVETADSLLEGLDSSWQIETANVDELGIRAARQQIVDSLNGGVAMAQYFGHSDFAIWSFSRLFTTAHARSLVNDGQPAVVAQWGCWNTYYVSPLANTLGHALMLSGDQGAAAVLGAATLTQTNSDVALGQEFLPLVTRPGWTIGQALVEAKQALAAEHPEMIDMLAAWTILGDPAMMVQPIEE